MEKYEEQLDELFDDLQVLEGNERVMRLEMERVKRNPLRDGYVGPSREDLQKLQGTISIKRSAANALEKDLDAMYNIEARVKEWIAEDERTLHK